MADELGEHVAYLELLQAIREHLSLVNTASYIGSKPQNVAGWVATQSVPTLKDFRARLVELAFYIREILQRPMKLGADALHILESISPQMPPWGVTTATNTHQEDTKEPPKPNTDRSGERVAHLLVSNLLELVQKSMDASTEIRRPAYTWQKLALLQQLFDDEKQKRARSEKKSVLPPTILIWGESCAGKSTMANALLGAPIFPSSPIPEQARLHQLSSEDRILAEIPGVDGMPPCPADCLQILRYLLASEECTVFLVMSSASYPMLSRIKLIEELSRLQCKLNLVFSKFDLYSSTEEEQVSRFLRGKFSGSRVFICGSQFNDESLLNELRSAAGLVGTDRLKLVAAASANREAESTADQLKDIIELVRKVGRLASKVDLHGEATFSQIGLSKPQIGAILLEVEEKFSIKIPDRDADQALRGDSTLAWLCNVVVSLN
jgi:acyl carrier protein